MDHRRFVTFLVFFFAFTYLYTQVIMPKFFPPPKPVAVNNEPADFGSASEAEGADSDSAENNTSETTEIELDKTVLEHPAKTVTIGSLDLAEGFYVQAELSATGASVSKVKLADPKFSELHDREQQVTVIGNNISDDRSFSTSLDVIDAQLRKHGTNLESVNWEVTSTAIDHAEFTFTAPDHSIRVTKRYQLAKIDASDEDRRYQMRNTPAGYTIQVELTIQNLSDSAAEVAYEIQGPVGIVLENRAHTRKYRDIKLEFLGEEDDVTFSTNDLSKLNAKHIEEAHAVGKNLTTEEIRAAVKEQDPWTGVFRYAGIDVQFFAALITPLDDRDMEARLQNKWIARTYPVMITENRTNVYESDISFRIASMPQKLEAKGGDDAVTHKYGFYVGPKYETLLDPPPFEATRVLDIGTGFFSFFGLTGVIARLMHYLLGTFHGWGLPYGICIILLTVLVRSCMFPISKKQAVSAAKMKALQPKLNELKQKYGEDKQKMAQAQMELWRKHNINPLSGCMPVLFQMPIFIGLYQCLNTAVDLRLSRFLWIDNLAAPDAMFNFPFNAPSWLGPHISILPVITVVLFLVQQKMFMPPPADEQAEMTQKMMNMMTFMFGALFWHQPAGLCLYFICSSVWGIAERKLLGNTNTKLDDAETPSVTVKESSRASNKADTAAPAKKGFFASLMEAAEEAQKQAEQKREKERKGKGGKKKR